RDPPSCAPGVYSIHNTTMGSTRVARRAGARLSSLRAPPEEQFVAVQVADPEFATSIERLVEVRDEFDRWTFGRRPVERALRGLELTCLEQLVELVDFGR